MHIRRKYRMPNSIEVVEFNSSKCPGKCKPRRPKSKPTEEAVKKNNQRRKQRECSRMVEKYFTEDDLALTLTWEKEKRPQDIKEAVKMFGRFARWLKNEYAKRQYELFWIRNIEVGPRGAWHVHLIVNRIDGAEFLINSWWTYNYGGTFIQYMHNWKEQGKDIGEYISKTKETSNEVVETSWNHSRNVKKVEGEDTIITGHAMKDKPRVPKGWYLDPNSMYEGENIDGYPFRTYTIRRIKPVKPDRKMSARRIRAMERAKQKRRKGSERRTGKADRKIVRRS